MTPRLVPDVGNEGSLPNNLEAERAVLGAILVNTAVIEQVATSLQPGQFYREAHRRVYTAMQALHSRRAPIDFVTLKEELARVGALDEVGGPAYIAALGDGVPRSTNWSHYVAIVQKNALLREIIYTGNAMVADAYAGAEDAVAILGEADRRLLALRSRNGHGLKALADTDTALFQALEWRVEHKGELRGLDTGFTGMGDHPSINEMTLGFRPGHLIVIAAATSVGKTSLSTNIAVNAAGVRRREGTESNRVALFSLEMEREELDDRILAQLSGIPSTRIQGGHVAESEWPRLAEALEARSQRRIHVDDRSGQTAIDIRNGSRQVLAEHGAVDLIVVDYIQLMAGTGLRKGATRTEELTDASIRLKELAKELSVPVLLLSQLRRHVGRPTLDDLRESGGIGQSADVVMLLYRRHSREGGPTECIFAKQRSGAAGTVMLDLDLDTTTFRPGQEALPAPSAEERQEASTRARRGTFARRTAGWEG